MLDPFMTAFRQPLCGRSGRYDLYYFGAQGDAQTYQQSTGGEVIQTSPNVWRVTVLCPGTGNLAGLPVG